MALDKALSRSAERGPGKDSFDLRHYRHHSHSLLKDKGIAAKLAELFGRLRVTARDSRACRTSGLIRGLASRNYPPSKS